MEPSGKDGRGGEVSLAAPGHDGMPVRSRPTTALAIWSSVLQPGSLSAGRQQGEHDRRHACRINTRAPREAKLADAAMAGTHQRPSYRLGLNGLTTVEIHGTTWLQPSTTLPDQRVRILATDVAGSSKMAPKGSPFSSLSQALLLVPEQR
jgi:hypothetical protein